MAEEKLSAREAALIAEARAALQQKPPAAALLARPEPAAATAPEPVAARSAGPASNADPAQRIAALMAVARTESEQLRRRQRRLYVWTPAAFLCVLGLWTLLWMWHRV